MDVWKVEVCAEQEEQEQEAEEQSCWPSECLAFFLPAIFFFFLGGFHPGSLPFPPLSVVFWSPFGPLLVEIGSLCFRCVFWGCFLMIFDVFLIHFWGQFYMFFAYLFEQCFCLLFPRTFFKCMHTFKTRDLRKTLFFSNKNAISEEPPLQTTYEKMHFLGWNRTLFFA